MAKTETLVIPYFEPNTIDYKPEDLCMGISLDVIYVSRDLDTNNTMSGSVSILTGKDSFLSTSYSEVSVLELIGGGNKESIGIESINIKYNTWYFPEVNIKFVDIRGNAVFNPMEKTNDSGYNKIAKGSFLKAFFTFPYPIFKLTVKGYFGEPVTYSLIVKGVPKAVFNSQTGNFEISADFIGHMYYSLTDIPMSLVMAAPYIDYGGTIELGNFQHRHGQGSTAKIPTFVDFISDVNKVLGNTKKDETINTLKNNKASNDKKITAIEECKKLLKVIQDYIEKFYEKTEQDGVVTLILDNKKYDDNKKENDSKAQITNELWNQIKPLKEKLGEESLGLDLVIIKNLDDNIPDNVDDKGNPISFYFKCNFDDDFKKLYDQKHNLNVSNKDIQKNIEQKEAEIVKNNMPYVPTVKNLVEMVIAHLNCLKQITNRCMNNIKKGNRSSKGIELELTDCNVKGGLTTMYPFTGFYNVKREVIWIGDVKPAQNFEEVNFIESIMKGITNLTQKMETVEKESELVASLTLNYPQCDIRTFLHEKWGDNIHRKNIEAIGIADYCKELEPNANDKDKNILPQVFHVLAERLILAYFLYGAEYANFCAKVEALKLLYNGYNEEVFNETSLWRTDIIKDHIRMFDELLKSIKNDKVKRSKAEPLYNRQGTDYNYYQVPITICGLSCNIFRKEKNVALDVLGVNYEVTEYFIPTTDTFLITKDITNDRDNFVTVIDYLRSNEITPHTFYADFAKSTYSMEDMHRHIVKPDILPILAKRSSGYRKAVDGGKEFEEIEVYVSEGENNFNNFSNWFVEGVEITWHNINSTTTMPYHKNLSMDDDDKIIFSFTISVLERNPCLNPLSCDFFNEGGIKKVPNICIMSTYVTLKYGIGYKSGVNRFQLTPPEHSSLGELVMPLLEEFYNDNKASFAKECRLYYNKEFGGDSTLRQNFINFVRKSSYMFFKYKKNEPIQYKSNFYKDIDSNDTKVLEEICQNSYDNFLSTIRGYINKKNQTNNNTSNSDNDSATATAIIQDSETSKYRKLAIYEVFKHLYDRWKFGVENNDITNISKITINDFKFRDAVDRGMDETLNANIDKVIQLLLSVYKGDVDMSIYEFLFEICKISDCLLLSLPCDTFNNINSIEKLRNIFKPYSYMSVAKSEMHPTFVVTYRQKDSQHLNMSADESQYCDDGIDFLNNTTFPHGIKNELGVFGVTYSLGNQSFFKDVQVSMDKPKVTEQSIASTLQIAQTGSKNSAASYGVSYHDLYDTYSNHSYQCTVTMMGNAQIAPMMYFQLNNVPLFKGGYYIQNVEHSITKEGMKTTFTGTRLSRNQYKLFAAKFIKAPAGGGNQGTGGGENGKQTNAGPGQYGGAGGNYNARYAKGGLKYTKEDTVIIIVPQFKMTDKNRQSPDLNPDDFSKKVHKEFKGILDEKGKGDDNGILYPYSDTGKEVFKERAYWVNRKMALELETQLKKAGYQVDMSYYNKSIDGKTDYKMPTNGVVKFNGKECTVIAIMLTVDALDKEVTNDAWLKTSDKFRTNVYYQPKKGIKVNKVTEVAMLPDISEKLAKAIKDRCNTGINISIPKLEGKKHACQIKEMTKSFGKIGYAYPPSVVIKNMSVNEIGHTQALALKSYRELMAKLYVEGINNFFESVKDYVTDSTANEVQYNYDEKMSKYYTWREAIKNPSKSEEWKYLPTDTQHIADLKEIYNKVLDPIVTKWKSKININSAYRSPQFNATLPHSSKSSQHCLGQALDISMYGSSNANLFQLIYNMMNNGEITLGQLIWEGDAYDKNGKHYPSWIHISLPKRANGQKNYVLHYDTVAKKYSGKGKWKPPEGISPDNPNPTFK